MKALHKVKKYIIENNLIEENDSVILGVSGGADSVCMYKMLLSFAGEMHFSLRIIHVHHGIRGEEANRDMEFVEEMCKRDGIDFKAYMEDVPLYAKENGISEEEAGRIIRYKIFEAEAAVVDAKNKNAKKTKIAVAHNLNDNAETFIHNLCRGTGISGLAGIGNVNGRIIRPILCLSRQEIEEYLGENNISYIDDSTNFSLDYTRNKIRNHVLPYLNENINGDSIGHINSVANELRSISNYIEGELEKIYERTVSYENGRIYIDNSALENVDEYMVSRVIRRAIGELAGKLKDITRIHIEDVLGLRLKQSGKYVMLPYNIIAAAEYNKIVLYTKEKNISDDEKNDVGPECIVINTLKIEENMEAEYRFQGFIYKFKILNVRDNDIDIFSYEKSLKNNENMYTKAFDYDKIKANVQIRYREIGDFLVVNSKGNRKKLKEYFVNEKIPSSVRDNIPLLCDGNHVIWVIGHRISEEYKISSKTENILIVERKEA